MASLNYTHQARDDLLTIWASIAMDNPAAADRMVDRIEKRVRILEHWPKAGAALPSLSAEARLLVERPYLILYRILPAAVQVVRILHGARDVEAAEFLLGLS